VKPRWQDLPSVLWHLDRRSAVVLLVLARASLAGAAELAVVAEVDALGARAVVAAEASEAAEAAEAAEGADAAALGVEGAEDASEGRVASKVVPKASLLAVRLTSMLDVEVALAARVGIRSMKAMATGASTWIGTTSGRLSGRNAFSLNTLAGGASTSTTIGMPTRRSWMRRKSR